MYDAAPTETRRWERRRSQVHLHARRAVSWRGEVGVVHAVAVLGLRVHRVISQSTLPKVVCLEVACLLVEAVAVKEIVTMFR